VLFFQSQAANSAAKWRILQCGMQIGVLRNTARAEYYC